MFRWILLVLALLGLVLAFTTKSPGLLGLGLLLGLVGSVGFVLALAADRVAANARPDMAMASAEELVALKKPSGAASSTSVTNVFGEHGDDAKR